MTRGVNWKFKRDALDKIHSDPKTVADVTRRVKAVADASNAQSSWGGYHYAVNTTDYKRPVGRVWSIGRSETPGSDRALRLLRNFDRAR